MHVPALSELRTILGDIDIYLFDQLLKGRITEHTTVLDAGCGNGRNIRYLMQAGVPVFGADISEEAVELVKEMAAYLAPDLPAANFVVADLAALTYPSEKFDVVVCSAVLHFSKDETHFRNIVLELWRVLKPGGILFCRFSTTIGLENKLLQVSEHKYQMSHGPVWFLADEAMLLLLEQEMNAVRLEPLKTVLVEQERTMTTWVLGKSTT